MTRDRSEGGFALKRARLSAVGSGTVALVSALVVSACGGTAAPVTGSAQAAQAVTVEVPHADRFAPFLTAVTSGSTVTFHNGDSDKHSVITVPGDPLNLNHTLQPGETWTVTLSITGSHEYYCSFHAAYDTVTEQVRALPTADHPDEPMQGLLVVSSP
jgi:plastocyanin